MAPRTKCRVCQQSTSVADGYCEFCGNALEMEAGDAALSARAERLAAAGPAEDPRGPISTYRSDGERAAESAFTVALLGFFCLPILAPVAFVLGRRASRQLAREERSSWMAPAATFVGGAQTVLLVAAIVVTSWMMLTQRQRLDAELRAIEERMQEIQPR